MAEWNYRKGQTIEPKSLHIEVIADYSGGLASDHAFCEVYNHFLRFNTQNLIGFISEHPVHAFSTIETGFWIGQEALHSEHKDLVIFSNTAPRGDIKWKGETEQFFACALLDNGIPIFAVHAGYNLSFIKERIVGLWKVNVTNMGTQFRSRDQYPEATMAIINANMSLLGEELDKNIIMDVPDHEIGSVDGYGNIKTTIRHSMIDKTLLDSSILRVTINGITQFVLNTLHGTNEGKTGDLCMVIGSSGGKKDPFIEFVRMQGRAVSDFKIVGPTDNGSCKITIDPVK